MRSLILAFAARAYAKKHVLAWHGPCNIQIKRGFSCINIRQVPWEVLKTKAEGRGFQHLPRDLANVNALQNHVRSLLLHKKENICYISRYSCIILFRLFTYVSRTQFLRTVLVLGPDSIHMVTAAILWPWYMHIETFVAMHEQRVNCLVNTRLFAGQCTAGNNVRHCFVCNNISFKTNKYKRSL